MKSLFLLPIAFLLSILFSCSSSQKEEINSAEETPSVQPASVNDSASQALNGDYVKKYPNGVVQIKGFYQNGKKNGQWTSFFSDGQIQSEGFFKDGLRDGKTTVYYSDGKVYYQGEYKDGAESGTWSFYDQQGNKTNEKKFSSE